MKSAPKAAFVTRLRSRRLTGQTARQLRGQSTIPWVEFSSTGETRLSGAHCIFKQEICNKPRPLNGLVERVFGLLRWHGRAFRLVMLQLPVTSPVHTLVGKIDRRPIGSFSYEKRLKRGEIVVCEVLVFMLKSSRAFAGPAQGVAGDRTASFRSLGNRREKMALLVIGGHGQSAVAQILKQ